MDILLTNSENIFLTFRKNHNSFYVGQTMRQLKIRIPKYHAITFEDTQFNQY